MTKKITSACLMLLMSIVAMAQTLDSDPIVKVMNEELNREFLQLKQKPVPAYFMSLRLNDSKVMET